MKNKRIQYNGGGELKLHKTWGDLDTSLNVQKNGVNISTKKNFGKGFSVNANLNKVRSKSSSDISLTKKLNEKVSIGVSKRKNQKPFFNLSFSMPTYTKKK